MTKPAQGILRYDRAALREAYRITRGQPYQLQALGATLIERFDAAVLDGKKRSDYVSLADLDQAATALVEQRQNAAFENHWADADRATHRLLAGLAWATSDEGARVQIDLAGIGAALRETRLDLPPGEAFRIVERLADEEVVARDGPTYRYAVPLYRRWVSWRWPPERIREEWIAGAQEEPRAEVRLSAGQG